MLLDRRSARGIAGLLRMPGGDEFIHGAGRQQQDAACLAQFLQTQIHLDRARRPVFGTRFEAVVDQVLQDFGRFGAQFRQLLATDVRHLPGERFVKDDEGGRLYRSERASTGWPASCSGDM